jgi:hypothetical protein
MGPKQFVLEKVILRTGERFQQHAEDEHPAINTVSAPRKFCARRIKGHHNPDAEPEKTGDHDDLAEQEKARETFRALGDHG